MFRRLRHRLRFDIVVLNALVILTVWLLYAYETAAARDEAVSEMRNTQSSLAHAIDAHVARTFETVVLVMERARDLALDRALAAPPMSAPVIGDLGGMVMRTPQVAGLAIVDDDGIARHGIEQFDDGAPKPLSFRFDSTDRDYFQVPAEGTGNGLFVGAPIHTKTSSRWVIPISLPVRDDKGRFAGIVVAIVNLDTFDGIFQSVGVHHGHVVLYHRDGHVLVHAPADPELIGVSVAASDGFDAIGRGMSGRVIDGLAPDHDERMLVTSRNIAGLPLVVAIGMPLDDVLANWRDRARLHFAIGLAGTVVLVLLTALLWRQIARLERSEAALREARDAAESANRAKSDFLARMSHELRTPLNAIIGFSEALAGHLFGPLNERQADYVADINRSGHHLLALINDILDISRVESGEFPLNEEWIDVGREVSDIVRLHAHTASRKQIDLKTDLPSGAPVLLADRRALRQMIINLLSNAVRFTPARGFVTVSVRPGAAGLEVSVADSGPGIPLDMADRVLDPFVQIGDSYSHAGGSQDGSGLGLAITNSLMQLHGGHVDIGVADSGGARVTLRFPADRLSADPAGCDPVL